VAADFDFIYSLNAHFPLPSSVFFIDTPVRTCMERMSNRKGREIFEHPEFLEKVLKGYRKTFHLFRDSPFHIHMINGAESREKVFLNIWEKIESLPIVKM
jgi:thymidylate kinase